MLGLTVKRFAADLKNRVHAAPCGCERTFRARSRRGNGAPTFFINGGRFDG